MNTTQQTYDFLTPASQPDELGILGSYRVISELGRGGMGYVFRAEDTRLKRAIALKVMNKKIAATPNSRARFIEEARAMAAVHHDNVAVIFEVGERNGTPFMAMELLKGQTLEAINLKKIQLGYEKILDFAEQIARGLAAAHEKGIVHRDIKPANIWIEEGSERVKILDFGLALAQTPMDRIAGTGSVIGTPGYLSPEQARTDPLDDRSDLYSLGVVLYELCTGRLPLASSTVSGQLIAILSHTPKQISELNPTIPAPLVELVHQLLAKEARDRPHSAKQVVEDIKRVTEQCHAKSEVALAINKLQLGLSEVVNKKQEDDLFADNVIELVPEEVPDPFAFPGMPPPATMPGTPSGPATAAAVAPLRRPASPTATPPVANASSSIDWKQQWPFVAIGVLTLLLISIAIYAFSGRTETPPSGSVAQVSDVNDSAVSASGGPAPATNVASEEPPAAPKPAAKPETKPAPAAKPPLKPAKPTADAKKQEKKSQNSDPKPVPKQDKPAPKEVKSEASNAMTSMSAPQSDTADPSSIAASELPPDSTAMKDLGPQGNAASEPKKSTVAVNTIAISSADGNGADSSVRRGAGDPLGLNHGIAVQTRNGAEIEHAYMRFDLSAVGKQRSKIVDAHLVLTLPGEDRPSDATLRLYGVDTPAAERWQESGRFALSWNNSYSKLGLSSLPVLAEKALSQRSNGNDRQVVIDGKVLTEFIRDSKTGSVTLILAGGRADNGLLPFTSRERGSDEAPKLLLDLPLP